MLGFRKVPLSLLYSPVISELTSFQRDFLMFAQLARDARNCLPYAPAILRSVVFPGRPFVGLKEIAIARDHLVAVGVFLHKATQRKDWLEIAPEYRNNDGENETSFGEEEKTPEQGELLLSPQVITNPQPAENRRKKKRTTESVRELTGNPPIGILEDSDSETRKLCQGKKAEEQTSKPHFARSEDEHEDDELWAELHRILGLSEMTRFGALWDRRLRTGRRALRNAVEDFKNKSPEERAKHNAGAYLTAAYENELRKVS